MKWWGHLAALCMLAGAARAQGVKSATKPVADTSARAAAPTTWSGVYTTEQAARGNDVYAGNCRSCHSPLSHTGETFETWWGGKRLSELFIFVGTRMPKNDPGSLPPQDIADVVAYLLQMNAMPAGKRELYPDADSLTQYRIELKAPGPKTQSRKPRGDP